MTLLIEGIVHLVLGPFLLQFLIVPLGNLMHLNIDAWHSRIIKLLK
jgi:hypothetical protein